MGMTGLETRILTRMHQCGIVRAKNIFWTTTAIAKDLGISYDDARSALKNLSDRGLLRRTADMIGEWWWNPAAAFGPPEPNQEVYADVKRGEDPAPPPGMAPDDPAVGSCGNAAPIEDPGPHTHSLSTACLAPDTFDAWWETRDLTEKADIFRSYHEELSRQQDEDADAEPESEADRG